VVRTPDLTLLVDTCIGNDKDRGGRRPFHMLRTGFLDTLRAAGVAPESVDVVICTHLHVDHVGWNTRLEDGRWVPTFPRARSLFARRGGGAWAGGGEGGDRRGRRGHPANHGRQRRPGAGRRPRGSGSDGSPRLRRDLAGAHAGSYPRPRERAAGLPDRKSVVY